MPPPANQPNDENVPPTLEQVEKTLESTRRQLKDQLIENRNNKSASQTFHPSSSSKKSSRPVRTANDIVARANAQHARAFGTYVCAFNIPEVDLFSEREHFDRETEVLDAPEGETGDQKSDRKVSNGWRVEARLIREQMEKFMGTTDVLPLKSVIKSGMVEARKNLKETVMNNAADIFPDIPAEEWKRGRRAKSAAIAAVSLAGTFLYASEPDRPKPPKGRGLNARLFEIGAAGLWGGTLIDDPSRKPTVKANGTIWGLRRLTPAHMGFIALCATVVGPLSTLFALPPLFLC
ncbi:hypothetical protein P7C70_g9120, partial [Phenoliferia sp. Uapishka_3]